MRVLLVTDWRSDAGGAETYIVTLRDALRAAGDEVQLLACAASSDNGLLAEERIRGSDKVAEQLFLQIINPFAVRRVRSAVRDFRPDVALVSHFAYHSSPAVLQPLRNVPTVISVMDYKSICPLGSKLLPDETICAVRAGMICHRNGCVGIAHWMRDRPRYALIRREIARVDRVLSPSRWVQSELAANGIPSEHLPLAVRPASPSFRRSPAPTPLFLYCGRLSREKGAELLIRAFARVHHEIPAARLRIVGDGPERPLLERLATSVQLDGAVTFAGRIAPDRVEDELVDAWALVAPSLWAEPFGLVAAEAIQHGVPVIASELGGLGEIVEQGVTGLLFRNGDEVALTECIAAVAQRRSFPSQSLPAAVVERVTATMAAAGHAQRIRSIFSEVVRESQTSRAAR